jgi:hypothetical protein
VSLPCPISDAPVSTVTRPERSTPIWMPACGIAFG